MKKTRLTSQEKIILKKDIEIKRLQTKNNLLEKNKELLVEMNALLKVENETMQEIIDLLNEKNYQIQQEIDACKNIKD